MLVCEEPFHLKKGSIRPTNAPFCLKEGIRLKGSSVDMRGPLVGLGGPLSVYGALFRSNRPSFGIRGSSVGLKRAFWADNGLLPVDYGPFQVEKGSAFYAGNSPQQVSMTLSCWSIPLFSGSVPS